MTIRNLDHLFRPRSVALLGASDRPSSVGAVLARNLRAAGFAGRVMLVNPRHAAVDGEPCHPDVGSLGSRHRTDAGFTLSGTKGKHYAAVARIAVVLRRIRNPDGSRLVSALQR